MEALDGIDVRCEGHVAVVLFSRPPQNFFDLSLIQGLVAAFEEIDADPSLRCILLKSTGSVFCAGAAFSTDTTASSATEPPLFYMEAMRLFNGRKPVVAAIQGPAIGGGLGLALVADFRVASESARFGANFVQIGLHPGFGITRTLPRVIGLQAATELLLSGRRIDAAKALALGLVDRVCVADELDDQAFALAAEIAANAPLAVQSTRSTMRSGLSDELRDAVNVEWREQRALFQTQDFREGVSAVKERRPGVWLGR